MRHTRQRNPLSGPGLTLSAIAVVGLLSFALLIYGDLLWQENFRRTVPVLDNLMVGRVALADGHLWLEELLNGNESVQIDMVRDFYDQAIQMVDACVRGESAIRGLSGMPLANPELLEQFRRLKWAIERSQGIAEDRWRNRQREDLARDLGRQHHTAYHGGDLLAHVINVGLQQDISKTMTAQRRIHSLALVVWGAILVSVGAALFLAGKRQRATDAALRESENKLRLLSSHLLTVQEEERRRLALELHDELGQSLTVLKLQVRAIQGRLGADQERLRDDCEQSLHYIQQTIENVRRISRDLSPSTLDDLGLTTAIRCLIEDFEKASEIKISADMPDIDGLFRPESEIMIYRIFQEALTNIDRHSQASHVSIEVEVLDNSVSFLVHDDGRGFDLGEIESGRGVDRGLGLTAMRERARMVGGTLDIISRRDEGARISLRMPFEKGASGEQL
jgi:signal transduction histidine kinase